MMNVRINITNNKALLAKLRESYSDEEIYTYQVLQRCRLDENKLPDSGDQLNLHNFFRNIAKKAYLISHKLSNITEVSFRQFDSPNNVVLYLKLINDKPME